MLLLDRSILNMNHHEYKIEHIKQRALCANLYIVDENASLLSFKTYEDKPAQDRLVLENITIAEAMKLAENNGFFKAKYQVLKVIQYFDVELVLTASDVEHCDELHQFSGGYNVTVLADTPEHDLIAMWLTATNQKGVSL